MGRPPKPGIETRWSASQPPGCITPEALYTAEEVRARLRMGRRTWRQLCRKGLKPIRFGRRDYVLGASVIETLTKMTEESRA